ncbi:MAG: patatin-like phospholipase family protein [Candidatus Pacebacteria bacterium]|nr:patatin-like phospholipase family protein [Candidatus Paceibacterota bacterium]
MKKTAIILSGGGCDCAYGGGFMTALGRECKITPDLIVAGSGSAGTAAYYCAKEYDAIERVWTRRLATPRFVNFFRPLKIMDIDYLVDVIFKKLEPLRVDTIRRGKTELMIAATRKRDGRVKFFSDWHRYDIFEVLRATKSIPYFSNKLVDIEGETYRDSMRSSGIRLLEEHINLDEYDTLILVRNGVNTWVQRFFGVRELFVPRHKNVIIFENDTKLNFSILNNSKPFLRKQFDKGYEACVSMKEVLQELSK